MMAARRRGWAPWLAAVGVLLQVVGLLWDAALHAAAPDLAAREGPFSLGNPSHALVAIGLALAAAGAVLMLVERRATPGEPRSGRPERLVLGTCLALLLAIPGDIPGVGDVDQGLVAHGLDPHGVAAAAASDSGELPLVGYDEAGVLLHLDAASLTVTEGEQAAATALVRSTKAATERFADQAVARAEGYAEIQRDASTNEEFVYLYNRAFSREGTRLDPGRPEALGYLRLAGRDRLLGALFLAAPGTGPRIGGGLTIWLPRQDLCFDRADLLVGAADPRGWCPRGAHGPARPFEMLRVWLFHHPRGPFAASLLREDLASLPPDRGP